MPGLLGQSVVSPGLVKDVAPGRLDVMGPSPALGAWGTRHPVFIALGSHAFVLERVLRLGIRSPLRPRRRLD